MGIEIDDSLIRNFESLKKFLNEKGYEVASNVSDKSRKDIVKIGKIKEKEVWFFGKKKIKFIVPVTEACYLYGRNLNLFCIKVKSENLEEIKNIFESCYFPFNINIEVVA